LGLLDVLLAGLSPLEFIFTGFNVNLFGLGGLVLLRVPRPLAFFDSTSLTLPLILDVMLMLSFSLLSLNSSEEVMTALLFFETLDNTLLWVLCDIDGDGLASYFFTVLCRIDSLIDFTLDFLDVELALSDIGFLDYDLFSSIYAMSS
jgi:hypothetical protein